MPFQFDNLHIEELDGEAVLYDRELGAVHRLDVLALAVWSEAGRSQSKDEIARRLSKQQGVDVDAMRVAVEQAVSELQGRDLLPVDWGAASSDGVADANRHAASMNDETFSAIAQLPWHTRRELLRGSATRMLVAAPLISTFFATGAFASGPSASAAFGVGNCKNIGYSCAVNGDCCADATGGCVANTCST